jgi:flagellar hook assembly protein FlgD
MKGQKISTILDTNLSHGDHAVSWNGENDKGQEVASGIYLFQLKMNDIPVSYSKGILLK